MRWLSLSQWGLMFDLLTAPLVGGNSLESSVNFDPSNPRLSRLTVVA